MRSFWDGHADIACQLEEVREAILARAASEDPEVHAAISQLMEASGKMLRPAFVLLASQFGSPDRGKMVRVSAAVEMLHMATLVHDDIIDGAPFRRGVSTLHALRGPRIAVLVGDWLFAACVSTIADLTDTKNAPALSSIVARICGSEISQSTDRFLLDRSIRRYLRRIAGKTAALFALSFHVGATEGGCPEDLCSVLRRLGYCLGMGFQIIDDILDFGESGAETGKPTGSDLSQGIYTLPVILGLRRDDGRLAAVLSRRPRRRGALNRAARLIDESGGIREARQRAARYTERSLREIGRLPSNEARKTLVDVTERLLHRTY
jgi:heptaprenyl diphosphate synthase